MQPNTAYEGQPIQVTRGDQPIVYGAMAGAILILAGVIAVLWRRGERARDRALKAAEEAREREVGRTESVLVRMSAMGDKFAALLDSQRDAFLADAAEQRKEFETTLRGIVERQAQADLTRDAKMTEVITALGRFVEAAQKRIGRSA